MKLHWSPRSPFVRKVMVVAHELGVAERLETIRTRVSMTAVNPALMTDNPLSKIPSLVLDDGSVLYDSRVICEYFAELAGDTHVIPAVPAARRLAMRRQALGDGILDFMILWRNERERPAQQQSPLYIEAYRAKYAATIESLDREARSHEQRHNDEQVEATLGRNVGARDQQRHRHAKDHREHRDDRGKNQSAGEVPEILARRIDIEHRSKATDVRQDRKSTRLNSSHVALSRMPSSA